MSAAPTPPPQRRRGALPLLLAACLGSAGPALAQPPVDALVRRAAPDDVTVRAVRLDAPLGPRRPPRRGRLRVASRRSPTSSSRSRTRASRPPRRPRRGSSSTTSNLYIAARCWDSHPEREVANELRRDNGNILGNENFTFVIDTFHDRRNGYLFQTNPLGALRDMTVTDDQQNSAWNGIWYVKTGRFEQGWTMEVVDPLQVAALPRQRRRRPGASTCAGW